MADLVATRSDVSKPACAFGHRVSACVHARKEVPVANLNIKAQNSLTSLSVSQNWLMARAGSEQFVVSSSCINENLRVREQQVNHTSVCLRKMAVEFA